MVVEPNNAEGRRPRVRRRFWLELILGGLFAALFLLTVFVDDWIEEVFNVDPDHGDGTLEWAILAVCGVATIGGLVMARLEHRRAPLAAAPAAG